MRKAGRILALLAGLGIILGTAIRAEAEENPGNRGVMQFQKEGGIVRFWNQDIAILQERAGTVSEDPFDPAFYGNRGRN